MSAMRPPADRQHRLIVERVEGGVRERRDDQLLDQLRGEAAAAAVAEEHPLGRRELGAGRCRRARRTASRGLHLRGLISEDCIQRTASQRTSSAPSATWTWSQSRWSSRVWTSWTRWIDQRRHDEAVPQTSTIGPPSRPANPMVKSPRSLRAAKRAVDVGGRAGGGERQHGVDRARQRDRAGRRRRARSRCRCRPRSGAPRSSTSTVAGSARRFSTMGCWNSTATCAASQAEPPLPITKRRPPAAKRAASASAQRLEGVGVRLDERVDRSALSRALRMRSSLLHGCTVETCCARRRRGRTGSRRRRRPRPRPWSRRAGCAACTRSRTPGSRKAS